ncbi:hypothetical protein CLOM621_05945 [Clostridium sp. M62/1]|nr:hypothetical protein CLOM621_05945 [Clostridium sp. M62/1]
MPALPVTHYDNMSGVCTARAASQKTSVFSVPSIAEKRLFVNMESL